METKQNQFEGFAEDFFRELEFSEGYKKDCILETRKLVKSLVDASNHFDVETMSKAMFYEILKSHRTLQANIVRLLQQFLELYQYVGYDLRNKGAVEFAEKASKINAYIPYI